MNIWFYAECAFIAFIIVVLTGSTIISIQLTIKKVKQNNYEKEVQEELNNIAKEEVYKVAKKNMSEIAESVFRK